MKNIVLACSIGAALLISGSAFARDARMTIDPSLIVRTSGSGLDAWSVEEGNDKAGGMWQGATGYSSSMQRQTADVAAIPSNRAWSRLNTRERHHRPASY